MEYRWQWMKPDRPGVWYYSECDRQHTPTIIGSLCTRVTHPELHIEGYWCFLCDLPTIHPPLPQLKLPAGWEVSFDDDCGDWRGIIERTDRGNTKTKCVILDADKPKVIRAVQAAVDVLSEEG